jgi:cellulose synthase operon protein C
MRQHGALARADRRAEADGVLQEALKADPKSVPLRMYAGEQQVAQKQWQAAVGTYEPLVAENPRNAIAMNNLAWSLYQLKDPRAVQVAEKAWAAAPGSAAIADTYGRALVASGDSARGLQLIRQAVSIAPKAPDLRLSLAEALAATGDKEGARRELDAVISEFPEAPQAKTAREMAAKLR